MGSVHYKIAGLGFTACLYTSSLTGLRKVDQDAQVSYVCDVIGWSFMNKPFWGTEIVRRSLFVYFTVGGGKIITLEISVELGKLTLKSIQTFLSFLLSFLLLIFTQGGCHKLFRSSGCPCWARNTASAIAIIMMSIDSHRPHCL